MFFNSKPNQSLKGVRLQVVGEIGVRAVLGGTEVNTNISLYKRADAQPLFGFSHTTLAEAFFDDLQTMVNHAFVHQSMIVADSLSWAFDQSYSVDIDGHKIANLNYMREAYGSLERLREERMTDDELSDLWSWLRDRYVVVIDNPIALNTQGVISLYPNFKGIAGGITTLVA